MSAGRESLLHRIASDRILTVPNVLSAGRIVAIPFFVRLVMAGETVQAALLLGALGVSDWADGWLARRTGAVSELGILLDPLSDRLLLFSTVAAVTAEGLVPTWLGMPVLVREPLMLLAAAVVALVWEVRIDVTWVGKAGTFLLLTAFPLVVLGASDHLVADAARVLGYGAGVAGVVTSWYAAFAYVPLVARSIREGDDAAPGTVTTPCSSREEADGEEAGS
ncbi:MAG: CDP-diacylglycerol--glycerol-3-phosphate 3-phosphatidyltransferase [Acidimicrobiales bacterium]|nr:MAG: CDP-diacylglycerol--glycerol-3-phosphate 3-phosphatidyltransferase [Acidimicrobiales bacterium]